ncbi:MAG: hypothetical protein R6U98_21025, partial [Pirellulaceae bacterium]
MLESGRRGGGLCHGAGLAGRRSRDGRGPDENDSTIETDHPWPDLPASIVDEILTEGGAAYADVLAARDEVAADIADQLAEFAADKAAALDRLAQQKPPTDVAIAETIDEAHEKLAADKHAQAEASQRVAKSSAKEIATVRETGDEAKASMEKARDAFASSPVSRTVAISLAQLLATRW